MSEPSKKPGFEVLDHPADMGLLVYAASIEELFKEAFIALNTTLLDYTSVERDFSESIESSGNDYEHLMYNWLSEILFLFDAEAKVFCDVEIETIYEESNSQKLVLRAKAHGGEYDPQKQQIKTYVKAITLHQLEIKKVDNIFQLRLFLDI